MPTATLDTFLTADELDQQLGLAGATLEAATRTYLDGIRESAVSDLEKVMQLFLVGGYQSFYGEIAPDRQSAFSIAFPEHIASVASISYRKADESALEHTGIMSVGETTIESLRTRYSQKRFFQIVPKTKWPADAHPDGNALITLNVGIDTSLVPLVMPKNYKQYLFLQASGYFDARVISPGSKEGGISSLDHDLARRISRGFCPAPTPEWEIMESARQAVSNRVN